MDTLLPLTLSWRNFELTTRQAYDLIGLSNHEQNEYLELMPKPIDKNWRDQGLRELEWCYQNGVFLFPFWHPEYPKKFLQMKRPPLLLTAKALPKLPSTNVIGVVGSRNLSFMAAKWLESEFSRFLQLKRPVVVSGGARGADQMAHVLSIRNNVSTICFLPSGLAEIYPSTLHSLSENMFAAGGGYLSPFSPFQKMHKRHFAYRNEMIALMTPLLFVVEARERSGTLLTANHSISYGAQVIVLPSAPSAATAGGLKLLRDGSLMAIEAEDLQVAFENLNFDHFKPLLDTKTQTNEIGEPGGHS